MFHFAKISLQIAEMNQSSFPPMVHPALFYPNQGSNVHNHHILGHKGIDVDVDVDMWKS